MSQLRIEDLSAKANEQSTEQGHDAPNASQPVRLRTTIRAGLSSSVLNTLNASGHGSYRTTGRYSAAGVRG